MNLPFLHLLQTNQKNRPDFRLDNIASILQKKMETVLSRILYHQIRWQDHWKGEMHWNLSDKCRTSLLRKGCLLPTQTHGIVGFRQQTDNCFCVPHILKICMNIVCLHPAGVQTI